MPYSFVDIEYENHPFQPSPISVVSRIATTIIQEEKLFDQAPHNNLSLIARRHVMPPVNTNRLRLP